MIRVNNLTYSYDEKEILKDISLHVEPGDFYALMGANGSGKSTLLKSISKALEVKDETVFVNEKDINTYSSRLLARNISVVSQRQHLNFDFSAHEMVLMGRNPYQKRLQNDTEEDRRIVETSMRKTDTWHLRNSSINKISGGEYQRVILARAMAQKTPILLLDEPLSNLDVSHQFEIISLLREINKTEKVTIILIVHDLNLALEFCDKLILLKNGRIYYDGIIENGLIPPFIKEVFNVDSSIVNVEDRKQIMLKK